MIENFEVVIFLMAILVVLSVFADKIKLPYSILLVCIGLLIGFAPFLPSLKLNPDVVFIIFLPPLIFAASFNTPWLDFKREIKTISTLAFPLVFCTMLTVAATAHYFFYGFSWPLGFLLGAIVSPPDAVAASGIIKGLGLPKKTITIIEGESLVNDASALIAYKYALAAVLTSGFVLWKAGLQLLWAVAVGTAAGLLVGFLLIAIYKKLKSSIEVDVSLSLLVPYIAYALAEKFHASGILAVVAAGLYIAWHSRAAMSFRTRLHTGSTWNAVIFLLNGIIFILIGLQLPEIVKGLSLNNVYKLVGDGLIISIAAIVIRIVWVLSYTARQRATRKSGDKKNAAEEWKNAVIVAWTGTRGVVSLATALALPLTVSNGLPFAKKDDMLLIAFVVILFTLIQGLTLPLLIKLLKLETVAGMDEKEESDLELMLVKSSIQYIKSSLPDTIDRAAAKRIQKLYEFNYRVLMKSYHNPLNKTQPDSDFTVVTGFLNAHFEVIKFKRLLIIQFQNDGSYNEEAINKAERKLDIEELWLNSLIQRTRVSEKILNEEAEEGL